MFQLTCICYNEQQQHTKKHHNKTSFLFLLYFMFCSFLLTKYLAISESLPVSNYYVQTLDGLSNDFNVVEAKSAYMSPVGLCVGLNGDFFVSDAERHLVFRIFDMWNSVEVYAGYVTNGFNGDGLKAVGTLLNGPSALSVNPLNGDLFIADSGNNLIRIVSNSARTVSSIAHAFNNPRGVYVSSNGFAYISDTDNHLIKKYEISTQQISIIGGGGYLDGSYDGVDAKLLKLQSPKNIFVISNGKKDVIYFTDSERVKSIDENGMYRIVDGGQAQSNLYGIYVSSGGEIYTSSQSNNFVQMKLLNSAETTVSIGGNEGYDGDNQQYDSGNTKFYEPSSLIVTQNSIIVADKSNGCIRKIDLQTKLVSTIVGGLVNHPYGENISPFNMSASSTVYFPFYYKNDFYFVERLFLLRKVSNGKLTTLLGRENEATPKYTANIPQRTYFYLSNAIHIGNGDVLLCRVIGNLYSFYNFNVETLNLTLILNESDSSGAMAVVGDSFENSTIYIMDNSHSKIHVLQNSKIVNTIQITITSNLVNQIGVIPNLRFADTNSLFLFSKESNILYEIVEFNGLVSVFESSVPAPTGSFLIGFSVNTNRSLLFWSKSQLYTFELESNSLKKIGGLNYLNVSNIIVETYGFNGEEIPLESSALSFPTANRDSSTRILITNTNYLSQVSKDGRISTIAGITPNTKTTTPLVLMRDSARKISYFIDLQTVKKLDETTGKTTAISTSLQSSSPISKTPYLTLTMQQTNVAGKQFGTFSKFDQKLYIKDACRIIRMDPEAMTYETIIGNECGLFKSGIKGTDSPCPQAGIFIGMTIDETNGDLLLAADVTIYRYSLETRMISTEFSFRKNGEISVDGIINNQTNPGKLSNIHFQEGHLYIITTIAIRKIEKLNENFYNLTTLVGNSKQGYSGDKLPALESSLDNPWAIYVKKNGDMIILDGSGTFIIRMYEKQSGLLVDIAGSRAVNAKFNGDGFGIYSVFTSFSKQVSYDEESGEIFLIDAKSYIRKVVPYCGRNYTFNAWNNTCDSKLICNETLANSSNACNGNGICTGFDLCYCKEGYEGQFCEIRKVSSNSTILIISIVIPIAISLIILVFLSVLIVGIVLILSKKKKKTEIGKMESGNIELSDTSFLPTSSMIISSSAGSSVGDESLNPYSRYTNIEKIGSGAFGSVYKVTDLKKNKLKAIKTVKFESLTDLNTIMKEASQLHFIQHENIIKINDYFITNDNLLIIDMDYYEMGDLTRLKSVNCSEKLIKQLAKQMLKALKFIHEEMKLIHRDVKPTNIFIKKLVGESIEIVLADFGLAKKYQEMSGQSFAGTPLYMSPEVALGSSYSYNTDIFSLGVSLYQIMTNDLSISISNLLMGTNQNAKKILETQMKDANCEYSNELIQIVLQMMEKDANQRPSASQLLSLTYFK